jgi:hypothetical protein
MKKVTVAIKLRVPNTFNGVAPWTPEQTLDDFVAHWLEEGCYACDHIVELPCGIVYDGFSVQWGKE